MAGGSHEESVNGIADRIKERFVTSEGINLPGPHITSS